MTTMKKIGAGTMFLALSMSVQAAPVLFDWGFDVDGTQVLAPDEYAAPEAGDVAALSGLGVDVSDYDFASGYGDESGTGTVTMSVTGAGAHYVSMYIDLEIDEFDNGLFNESVTSTGTASAGQSYEADEPGFDFPFGDIYDNFFDQTLDNSILAGENDHAMALAWDFSLAADETAIVSFLVSDLLQLDGIVLSHNDADSNENYLFSSSITISGPPVDVPEPGTFVLLALGLAGVALSRYRTRPGSRR